MTAPATSRQGAAARAEVLEQIAHAFWGNVVMIRRLRGRETHYSGELSLAQYNVLFALVDLGSERELSTRDLAAAAELATPTVTRMLDSLVAMGVVERRRSDVDRRLVTCTLTERGRQLATDEAARLKDRWKRMLAGFSNDELLSAVAVLERVRKVYEEIEIESS
jgi:DNA-binding MarR family transcriptional regulator